MKIDNCIIVAKGPTARYLKKSDFPNTYLVCINQACKFVDKPDFVFMNDIESVNGLTCDDIKYVKHFVVPEYPHMNEVFNINVTKEFFIDWLSKNEFKGKLLTYNLHTSPFINKNLIITDPNCVTTLHTAIYYMNKIFKLKQFITYGAFIKHLKGYHVDMEYLIKEHSNPIYKYNIVVNHYSNIFEFNVNCLATIEKLLNLQIQRF